MVAVYHGRDELLLTTEKECLVGVSLVGHHCKSRDESVESPGSDLRTPITSSLIGHRSFWILGSGHLVLVPGTCTGFDRYV